MKSLEERIAELPPEQRDSIVKRCVELVADIEAWMAQTDKKELDYWMTRIGSIGR
jgi:hypothetical protein